MGFLVSSTGHEVRVVHTVAGKLWLRGEHHPKARVWLLEDREAVLAIPARQSGGSPVERIVERLTGSEWSGGRKLLTATLEDGGELRLDGRGCGCNMGAVGSAGPVEGQYHIVRVRTPDWHVVSKA